MYLYHNNTLRMKALLQRYLSLAVLYGGLMYLFDRFVWTNDIHSWHYYPILGVVSSALMFGWERWKQRKK